MKCHVKAAERLPLSVLAGAALLLVALHNAAAASPTESDLISARSSSGQFMAYASRSAQLAPALFTLSTNRDYVRLEPNLATVSCERIKQLLLRELDVAGPWRASIYLVLYPPGAAGNPIAITSERFKNGWQYRLELPTVVERPRYVRAIVQVLLMELANRTASGRPAEIPAWLVEGLSQLLLASSEAEIILPPPSVAPNGMKVSGALVSTRRQTPLQQAEKKLAGRPPLTFEALSWPSDEDLADDAGGLAYRGSAQLFVSELLRFPDGRASLQRMLASLPNHLNWQFAFLEAFHAHFDRPLDVEKWWALSLIKVTGRYAGPPWPPAESWQKLDQVVHAVVQIRTRTNELPLRAEVGLQTVLLEWDPVRQTQALRDTVRELQLLRLRIAQEYVRLLQDYSQVIESYLQQRDRSGLILPSARGAGRQRAVEDAVQQLNALDTRRLSVRPGPPVAEPSGSSAGEGATFNSAEKR